MSQADDERRRRAERARRVGVFRYELIRDVIDPALPDSSASQASIAVSATGGPARLARWPCT